MIALDHILSKPLLATQEAIDVAVSFLERRVSGDLELLKAYTGRPIDGTASSERRGAVAVIPVYGAIFRHANMMTEACGYTTTAALGLDITTALDDPQCAAIVLDLDSPGGQADGISELAALIRAGTGRKPIVAYSDGEAASAAYWLASACSEVVGSATSMWGSVGVKMAMTKRAPKNGEASYEWVSDQSPDKSPDPATEKGKAVVQRTVNDMASVFISAVAEYRDVSEDKVRTDFGKGWILIGAQAVDAGMVDRIGSLEDVISGLEESSRKQMSSNFGMTASQDGMFPKREGDEVADWKAMKAWFQKGMPDDFDPSQSDAPPVAPVASASDTRVADLEAKLAAAIAGRTEAASAALQARRESIEAQAKEFLAANMTRVLPFEREGLKASLVQAMMDDDAHPLASGSRAQNLRDTTAARPQIKELSEVVPSGALPAGLTLLAQRGEQEKKDNPNTDTSPQAIEALFDLTAAGQALKKKGLNLAASNGVAAH